MKDPIVTWTLNSIEHAENEAATLSAALASAGLTVRCVWDERVGGWLVETRQN